MKNTLYIVIGIILFGAIWGFAEATAGAVLHLANSPHKGQIMTSFGVMVMSLAAAVYKPKNTLAFMVGLGVVASLVKGVDVLFLGLDSHVMRVMVVIPLEAAAFGAIASIFHKSFYSNNTLRPVIGAASAYASFFLLALVYVYGGIGSKFWVGMNFTGIVNFALTDGTIAAVLALVTTDAGFRVGASVKAGVEDFVSRNPLVYYLASLAVSGTLLFARLRLA
ncbi:MAG: hypothetical protein ABH834_04830 [Candidatus Altiarchaeota archaeon]